MLDTLQQNPIILVVVVIVLLVTIVFGPLGLLLYLLIRWLKTKQYFESIG